MSRSFLASSLVIILTSGISKLALVSLYILRRKPFFGKVLRVHADSDEKS